VTENGLGAADQLVDGQVNDDYRIKYLADHVKTMKEAITDGVEMIGYCAWSFSDLLSWLNGYRKTLWFRLC
jgi:Beta-glucosidase/6-phospho-beta-glucosidase/beta-galactosidase